MCRATALRCISLRPERDPSSSCCTDFPNCGSRGAISFPHSRPRAITPWLPTCAATAKRMLQLFTARPASARALDGMPEPPALPAWLSEADLDYYTQAFVRTGFRGALNRLRNIDRDWEELARVGEPPVEQPVLFIGGERDSAVRFGNLEGMRVALPNLRK